MKEPSEDLLGGVTREQAMLGAGFCVGLSIRSSPELAEWERKRLHDAGTAMHALLNALWGNDPACLCMRDRLEQLKKEKGKE